MKTLQASDILIEFLSWACDQDPFPKHVFGGHAGQGKPAATYGWVQRLVTLMVMLKMQMNFGKPRDDIICNLQVLTLWLQQLEDDKP